MKLHLDDKPILSVTWYTEQLGYETVRVGVNNITKIDAFEQCLGEYSIVWLQAWNGKKLMARYNARNIDAIAYEEYP
jgi:hypothetical protein